METLANFLADPDGWRESGMLDDSAVGDNTMQVKHSPCLLSRTPN